MDRKTELRRKKNDFIKKYIQNFLSVFKTCEDTNVAIEEFYQWLKKDKNFQLNISFARDVILDEIEATLFRRAMTNPKIALKVLERWRPERWGEIKSIKGSSVEIENFLPKEFYYITTEQFEDLARKLLEQDTNIKQEQEEEFEESINED